MMPRAGIFAAVIALCLCALFVGGCNEVQRQPRTLIEPTWSHGDPAAPAPGPAADASVKAPPRKPLIESLLSYVPMTPFD